MRLKDRTAIVTGSWGGMGLGISKCLTRLTAKDLFIANPTPMQCEQSPGNIGNTVAFLA